MLIPCLHFPLAAGGSVLLAIAGIGFLIFVHEFGHYLACRLTGTRVETFSIGFGTRLFGWERRAGEPRRFTLGRRRLDPGENAMDFRVALIPLGGYVKMAGENPGDERTGASDEFPGKPMWARVFIVSAGVIMNLIAACALYFVAYAAHVEQEPAIAGFVNDGGPAWAAGVEPGDRVITIAGQRTRSFIELKTETVFLSPHEQVEIVVEREGEERTLDVVPRYDEDAGAVLLKILPPVSLSIKVGGRTFKIGPTEPASVNGRPARGGLDTQRRLHEAIRWGCGAPVEVVTASGEILELVWKPVTGSENATKKAYKIGIEPFGRPVVEAVRGRAAHTFQPGDRLVAALGGERRIELTSRSDVRRLWSEVPIDHLEVERGPETLRIPVDGATPTALQAALADLALEMPPSLMAKPLPVGTVTASPGDHFYRYPSIPSVSAGLKPGDRILEINGRRMKDWNDVVSTIGAVTTVDPLEILVLGMDEEERQLEVVPVALERLEGPEFALVEYVEPYPTEGLLDAAGLAFARTGREIVNIFRLIGAFFEGRLSFQKNVGGPVTIVVVSSRAAERTWLMFLLFLAYISVTLAVLNILPIPILDGGHLLFLLIEKVKGSPLKEETMGKLQFVGLMMLLVLMFFAFKNDVFLLLR